MKTESFSSSTAPDVGSASEVRTLACFRCQALPAPKKFGIHWNYRCPNHQFLHFTAGHTMKTKRDALKAWNELMSEHAASKFGERVSEEGEQL